MILDRLQLRGLLLRVGAAVRTDHFLIVVEHAANCYHWAVGRHREWHQECKRPLAFGGGPRSLADRHLVGRKSAGAAASEPGMSPQPLHVPDDLRGRLVSLPSTAMLTPPGEFNRPRPSNYKIDSKLESKASCRPLAADTAEREARSSSPVARRSCCRLDDRRGSRSGSPCPWQRRPSVSAETAPKSRSPEGRAVEWRESEGRQREALEGWYRIRRRERRRREGPALELQEEAFLVDDVSPRFLSVVASALTDMAPRSPAFASRGPCSSPGSVSDGAWLSRPHANSVQVRADQRGCATPLRNDRRHWLPSHDGQHDCLDDQEDLGEAVMAIQGGTRR